MSPSLIRNGGTITGYACNGKDPPPLFVEPHHLRYYSVDASGYCVKPSAVAFPGTAEDVAGLVRRAISGGTSVTARGGGTGLVGGSLNRGIILDMSGFRKVRINEDTADAGPGVPRGMLDEMLEGSSRFFAPNPSVGRYCTIGGMVATNASGSRSLKYGSTLDNLEEVTLVDGRGDIITLPQNKDYSVQVARICGKADLESYPATTKNSCGYRLDAVPTAAESHRVVAASEGTLGVIISARLRTFPEPRERRLVVIGYDSELEAAEDCAGIVRHRPSALEVVGPDVLECAMTPAICLLLAEFDTPADDWEGGAEKYHIRKNPGQCDRECGRAVVETTRYVPGGIIETDQKRLDAQHNRGCRRPAGTAARSVRSSGGVAAQHGRQGVLLRSRRERKHTRPDSHRDRI